jgi:DNA-binding LacI/PurR family transcriptional regulator
VTPSDVPKKPTIRDVAAAAGVSYGTVSRVLNGGHWVSPEARAAVDAAIVSTGYTTNQAARSLATGKTGSLAFLLTESQHVLLSDPNMALLLRGATDAVSERGMTLVLLIADTEREQANAARYVRAGHVDGVLLVSSHESDDLLGSLVNAGVPTVCSGIPLGRAHRCARRHRRGGLGTHDDAAPHGWRAPPHRADHRTARHPQRPFPPRRLSRRTRRPLRRGPRRSGAVHP